MNAIKESYENGECPDCGEPIPNDVVAGQACSRCGHVFVEETPNDDEPVGMSDAEADADTLKSAGMGTDEDYGGGDNEWERWQGDSDGSVGCD